MATTLIDPKLKILRYEGFDMQAFQEGVIREVDRARGQAVSETLKVTWLAPSEKVLLCIIEWCEWVK